jgi:hypothetical protein
LTLCGDADHLPDDGVYAFLFFGKALGKEGDVGFGFRGGHGDFEAVPPDPHDLGQFHQVQILSTPRSSRMRAVLLL